MNEGLDPGIEAAEHEPLPALAASERGDAGEAEAAVEIAVVQREHRGRDAEDPGLAHLQQEVHALGSRPALHLQAAQVGQVRGASLHALLQARRVGAALAQLEIGEQALAVDALQAADEDRRDAGVPRGGGRAEDAGRHGREQQQGEQSWRESARMRTARHGDSPIRWAGDRDRRRLGELRGRAGGGQRPAGGRTGGHKKGKVAPSDRRLLSRITPAAPV